MAANNNVALNYAELQFQPEKQSQGLRTNPSFIQLYKEVNNKRKVKFDLETTYECSEAIQIEGGGQR